MHETLGFKEKATGYLIRLCKENCAKVMTASSAKSQLILVEPTAFEDI